MTNTRDTQYFEDLHDGSKQTSVAILVHDLAM